MFHFSVNIVNRISHFQNYVVDRRFNCSLVIIANDAMLIEYKVPAV